MEVHLTTLLEKEDSGFHYLLVNDKKDDLERLFRLLCNFPKGLVPVAAIVKDHITKMGVEIVGKREASHSVDVSRSEKDANPLFVQSLLDLHEKYESLVNEQFKGHAVFHKVLKEAFEYFVNMDVGNSSTAELISTFCDRILKTSGAKLSDDEIEEYLEKCVKLFCYLHDKDLFSEVYRNQLAKRLLMSRSSSSDAEMSMIGKLKLACGAHFTSKLEGMIKDLLTGDDLKKSFKEQVRNNLDSIKLKDMVTSITASSCGDFVTIDGVEFAVYVLTTGHWPTPKTVEINLPETMTQCMKVYEHFYDSRTSHRCLNWVPEIGRAVV